MIDRWTRPLTVVVASDDTAPRPHRCREMARRARFGVIRVVPNCGHYVPIERPDVLVPILRDVIQKSKQTGCQ